jgi:hypothetical protein
MPDLETLADQSDKVENVPGIFFAPHGPNSCCLCGSTENLTGEHKVKRTALSQEFGSATMAIGVAGDEKSKLRYAQSPKSKAFHFEAKLCARCNGTRTQPADREFDRVHMRALSEENSKYLR